MGCWEGGMPLKGLGRDVEGVRYWEVVSGVPLGAEYAEFFWRILKLKTVSYTHLTLPTKRIV